MFVAGVCFNLATTAYRSFYLVALCFNAYKQHADHDSGKHITGTHLLISQIWMRS
jgi:hypothetical protein